MKLVAPLEIGIAVADMEAMRAFYEDVLGLEPISIHEVPPAQGAAAGMCDEGYRIQRLQATTGERIKLAQPHVGRLEHDDREGAVLGRRGHAFITFIVDDLAATIGHLRSHGARVTTGDQSVEVREGVHLAFAEDPEGNYLEFVEYDDLPAYRPDLRVRR